MPRSFWLLSDRKTIREITSEQYRKMIREDYDRINKRLLVKVWGSEVYMHKGKQSFLVDRQQLLKTLKHKVQSDKHEST